VYYCPRCDRAIQKEQLEKADRELQERFGVSKLSELKCPICNCEYIDLDRVEKGGEAHVGKKKGTDSP
jgi:hypothetical protein